MRAEEFSLLVDKIQNRCKRILVKKATQYAGAEDRLENFVRAGDLQDMSPAEACYAMLTKHLVSLAMMLEKGNINRNKKVWDEKVTDAINYLILFEACLIDMGIE